MLTLALTLLASLLACGSGNIDSTTVSQLQVITVKADPPEAGMGDTVTLDVYIGNPDGFEELDILVWTCALVDDRCLEVYLPDSRDWLYVGDASSGHVQIQRRIPEVDLDLLEQYVGEVDGWSNDDYVEIGLHVLVCEGGTCDIIYDAWEALTYWSSQDLREDLSEDLLDPSSWLTGVPIEESAYAARTFRLSLRSSEARNINPTGEARFAQALEDQLEVAAGSYLELGFYAFDPSGEAIYGYGFTTLGRFEDRRVQDDDGAIRQWLRAPRSPGTGKVWMVFDDRDGGIDVWEKDLVVK